MLWRSQRSAQTEPGAWLARCRSALIPLFAGLMLGVVLAGQASEDAAPDVGKDVAASGDIDRWPEPVLAAVESEENSSYIADQIGTLHAEVLRLRSLFHALADVAELHDGEFDIDSEPLLEIARRQDERDRVVDAKRDIDLAKSALDPITRQAEPLRRIFLDRRQVHDMRISGRPLRAGSKSSGYGYRTDPASGERALHRGLDFAGKPGEPILSLADGVVTFSGVNGAYGNLVEIEHGDGYRTRYAHNLANLVSVGEPVRKGQAIALLGSTGRSTGPHLHLEVRHEGQALDPRFFTR